MRLFGNMRPSHLQISSKRCNKNINKNCCFPKEPVFCNGQEIYPVFCCDKKRKPKVNCNKNLNKGKKCCIVEEPVFCNGVEQIEPLCGCVIKEACKKQHPCKSCKK